MASATSKATTTRRRMVGARILSPCAVFCDLQCPLALYTYTFFEIFHNTTCVDIDEYNVILLEYVP
jgi:hypothetical protein